MPLRLLLLAAVLWLSWLGMTLVHEAGHVIGAGLTGGTVRRVVWHPAVLSRTDVLPNPWPQAEVWAGPVFGCVVPAMAAGIAGRLRWRSADLLLVFAGFCLIANGAYLGVGAFDPVGDAKDLIAHGTGRWELALFGLITVPTGLWAWHRAGPALGFGRDGRAVPAMHAYACVTLAAVVTATGFVFGNRGVG